MSADEQRLFRLYGKLPNKKDLLQNKLKERKYFDSGDYALSKAGKATDIGVTTIGREHPVPEKIPHIAPPTNTLNGQNAVTVQESGTSPIKEHSFIHRETSLNRETSADDFNKEEEKAEEKQETSKA
ncbi:camp-regulated phospho protein/endosulfine conserved region-domain-containing protein [Massariosphaeria phaeospora]|uniref:mRNA stability protein n=1 Tax=Massariosphaeria phaeospora TaxID=100035 RepID=A0A7C8I7B5_9PLEO|nr:camp-regulated phospho protein/endosulfine conserved region-domain-containing protein [Massariosphaeria phaeospora]